MKEVKKCSISGIAFTLEADAFQTLARYLESLKETYKNTDDGREIVEDIEARIAELILSRQENSRVVECSLVEDIITQMGSAEVIRDQSGAGETPPKEALKGEARIPRRLYRDMASARLGGVCSGVAKYFSISPTWTRLIPFIPLLVLLLMGWIPIFWWVVPLMSNLFAVFLICYLIMWFAVPTARTPRQRLEQNGQRITVQSIEETSAANRDIDAAVKPLVAKVIYALGQVVLIFLKIVAGLVVFGLILAACGLLIGLFITGITGPGFVPMFPEPGLGVWTVSLGIIAALIPILLLIYVLMCLIASRKPSGKTVLITFLFWVATIIGQCCVATHEMHRTGWFNWETVDHYDPDLELSEEPLVLEPQDSLMLQIAAPAEQVDSATGATSVEEKSYTMSLSKKQYEVKKQASPNKRELKNDSRQSGRRH